MKQYIFYFLSAFLLSCSADTGVKFDQVGYLQTSDKLRYFTINYSVTDENLSDDQVKSLIEKDGYSKMHTAGKVTASFYYKSGAPDITMLKAERGNEVAHNADPDYSVWLRPNGSKVILDDPGEQ